MKKPSKKLTVILAAAFCLLLFLGVTVALLLKGKFGPESVAAGQYTSVTDLAVLDGSIYAADKTGGKVYRLSADGKVAATYAAETQVNGVCATADAVYAMVGAADGKVIVLDPSLGKTAEISVGHTPGAMVICPS